MTAFPPTSYKSLIENAVIVNGPEDFQNIDSSKVYMIDGEIDMGSTSIEVPETGITLFGFGFNVACLRSSENNYTMFTSPGAGYAGDIFATGFEIATDGTGSKAFDVDNQGNFNAIEFDSINFTDCTAIGDIRGYRQILGRNIGFIRGSDGFTLHETMAGGVTLVDSIVLLSNNPVGYTLFNEGGSLVIQGSIRSNLNALNVPSDWQFSDIAPVNVIPDEGFTLSDFRTTAADCLPNFPSSDVKAYFKNCRGIQDTYIGGDYTISEPAATSFGAVDTLVKMAGTTAYVNLAHFSQTTHNAFVYDSNQARFLEIEGIVSFEGSSNRVVGVQVRQWDDSAGAYVNLGPEYTATLNGGAAGTRSENMSFSADGILDQNDRIEVWIKNKTDTTDITASIGGRVHVEEK